MIKKNINRLEQCPVWFSAQDYLDQRRRHVPGIDTSQVGRGRDCNDVGFGSAI